jgi:hydroxyacid-oxoacid transhydrogenase
MMLASTTAGIGFGNAGVHLPHAMSYPISAMARNYLPPGYPDDHTIVPHGISVILTAPAVFRWTASADPARHIEAAGLLGVDVHDAGPEDAGRILSDALIELMRQVDMPNGMRAVGITEEDIPGLVAGTLPQSRITILSPRPASEDDYREIFSQSFDIW